MLNCHVTTKKNIPHFAEGRLHANDLLHIRPVVDLCPSIDYTLATPLIATRRKGTVGKYAAENGSTKAARYFSRLLDNRIISEKAYVRCVR